MRRRYREKKEKADNESVQPNGSTIESFSVASRWTFSGGGFGMQLYVNAAGVQAGRKFRKPLKMMSPLYYIR